MSGLTWVVARTKPRRERWAAENVARQGCAFYLPRIHNMDSPEWLFPGYLFVEIEEQWRFLLGTFGIIGLIMSSSGPTPLPRYVISDIKSKEDSDGFVVIDSLESTKKRIRTGDMVRVVSGIFEGRNGICLTNLAKERVQVLIDILNQKTRVTLPVDCLEAV